MQWKWNFRTCIEMDDEKFSVCVCVCADLQTFHIAHMASLQKSGIHLYSTILHISPAHTHTAASKASEV